MTDPGTGESMPSRPSLKKSLLAVCLISCLYLPTLASPFDFIDDGNLVYPAPPMSARQRLELVWAKIKANYVHLGPFRPVLWMHWEIIAEFCRGNPVCWRCARFSWETLATGMLFWLLVELGIASVDFNSIFIGLCRWRGIPADHVFGPPITSEKPEGDSKFCYCWAQFWVADVGWIPVDPSRANKYPSDREYYFGTLGSTWITLAHGRDVVLEPPQKGPRSRGSLTL
jgi:hypothetical protein